MSNALQIAEGTRILTCAECGSELAARSNDPAEHIEHNADGSHTWSAGDAEATR